MRMEVIELSNGAFNQGQEQLLAQIRPTSLPLSFALLQCLLTQCL